MLSEMPDLISAPTLYPSTEQFNNPILYLSEPENVAMGKKFGILKIVPPKNWKPPLSINMKTFKFITRLQRLSELNIKNRYKIEWLKGYNNYMKMNHKRVNKQGFVYISDKPVHLYDLYQDRANLQNYDQLNRQDLSNLKEYIGFLESKGYKYSESARDEKGSCSVCHLDDDPTRLLLCDECDTEIHMRCLDPPLMEIPEGLWFCDQCLNGGSASYGFEEDHDSVFTLAEFFQHCQGFERDYFLKYYEGFQPSKKELEAEFWRLVEDSDANVEVRYGADIHKNQPGEISGFPVRDPRSETKLEPSAESYCEHPFNLTNLPFAKGSLLRYIQDEKISGMTVPWIYVGSLFSTFCWHKEDHYTFSCNYCHIGSSKKWYGIPESDAKLFEDVFNKYVPDYFQKQPDLLHQLVSLLSPKQLKELSMKYFGKELRIVYADQNPNEFIVTFPEVYHSGFNCGFNFNEAVNFTTPYWVPFGAKSISDYQLVQKENVFNYTNLMKKILDDFEHISTVEDLHAKELHYSFSCKDIAHGQYMNMVRRALEYYSKDWLTKKDKYNLISRKYKFIGTIPQDIFVKDKTRKRNNDLLCDKCKTSINFIWVELGVNPARAALLTPESTPNASYDRESEFRKIVEEAKSTPLGLGIKREADQQEHNSEENSMRRRSKRLAKEKERDFEHHQQIPGKQTEEQKLVRLLSSTERNNKRRNGRIVLCLQDFTKFILESVNDSHAIIQRCLVVRDTQDDEEIDRWISTVSEKIKILEANS
ncbi:BA75_02042T0 [Komagataella pastoris]|uniref:BA75_02042T0 n=1 Tax=Komagataella pastoris TaxID=4922 RepID=A0A1B2JCJ8_PICPA|nr:BA75_02042T0 [Komagataella pastoris]